MNIGDKFLAVIDVTVKSETLHNLEFHTSHIPSVQRFEKFSRKRFFL
jgi:hypothetical protein